jgi:hypothetical protein
VRTARFHDAARLELRQEVSYYAAISPDLGLRLAEAVEEAHAPVIACISIS